MDSALPAMLQVIHQLVVGPCRAQTELNVLHHRESASMCSKILIKGPAHHMMLAQAALPLLGMHHWI